MQTILLSLSTITDGEPTDESRVHGAPNPSLLKEHGLVVDYPPVDFINALMPKMNRKNNFCDYVPMVK